MTLLYLVTESDNDAIFYALCATKMTGGKFDPVPLKNRKGDGISAVQRQLKYALRGARAAAGSSQPVAFIAAIDNDRAPHEEHITNEGGDDGQRRIGTGLDRAKLSDGERARPNRFKWMMAAVEGELGSNRSAWKMPVALAVPVEMLESWIVRALNEKPPQPMAHFSLADSDRARKYYKPAAPPPQWKDLAAQEQSKRGCADKRGFYCEVVKSLDAPALASRSLSFRMFKEWLDGWTVSDAAQG